MADIAQPVTFVGVDQNGKPLYDIVVNIPEPLASDIPCTDRQLAAVRRFYCSEFDNELTYSQAHSLLSYREYATACAEYLARGYDYKHTLLFSRLIAAFISSDEQLAEYTILRSNRRFRVGSEATHVVKTKWFNDIALFYYRLRTELAGHQVAF